VFLGYAFFRALLTGWPAIGLQQNTIKIMSSVRARRKNRKTTMTKMKKATSK